MPLVQTNSNTTRSTEAPGTPKVDSAEDPVFGRLTKLARRVLNVHTVLISLVDGNGRLVPNVSRQLDRGIALQPFENLPTHCENVVATGVPLRLEDSAAAGHFRDNDSLGDLRVAAYFGVPIKQSDGAVLGSIAAIDDACRAWTADEEETLLDFAEMVTTEIGFWYAVTDAQLKADDAKAAEERLAESEYRYRNVIDNINEIVFQTDDAGRWTFLNPAWETITGYTIGESLGSGFFDRVHPDDRETNLEMFAPLLARRIDHCRHEIRYLYKNGGYRWIEVYARLTISSDGRVVGTSGTMTDITDRYESIKRIAESEVRFRSVVECLGEGLVITGLDDRVQYVNARMAAMTGFAAREMIGRRTHDLLNAPNDQEQLAERKFRRAHGVAEQYETEYRRKNGDSFWVEVHATPFRDADGDVVGTLSANLDITSRKAAENRLVAMTSELQRSNESLQEFASVASHDLQEPLRKIQTYSERLRKKVEGALSADAIDCLERIDAANGRMQSLIRDLLLYSRVTTKAQPFKSVDLNQVVSGVLSDLEARIQKSAGIVRVGPLPEIAADPLQMRQLFQNLISNALKFHKTSEPPVVDIRAEIISAKTGNLERDPAKIGAFCRIHIEDHGIGFDPKYADRVFEVFERLNARSEYEGTGMGLAICRRIAERHGGKITATSAEGEGTTFTIDLCINYTVGQSAGATVQSPVPQPQLR